MRVNDEQPEGASKRAREDDPEEGGVPADDAAASAAASESASAQDGPDAEAGEILTASEGLAAASLASAAPMAAAPARDEAAANASVDPAATAEAAASASGVASASAPPPTVQEPAAQDPAASAAPAFADDAAHAAPPMPRLTNEQLAHLLQSRAEAKARRDFAAADAIRGQLDGYGIKIIDGRQPGMIGTWAAADGRRCAARASSRSSASARSPRRLLPLLHLSPLLLCPATLTARQHLGPRDYFLDPLACAPKPKPTRKPSPPTPNENRRYYTLLLRAWTPGVERIAHYTSTPDDMLYPIFLRVFPSKLDAEQIGAGGRGECSAARARMENESTTKTADPESGRPGNRAPQASAASARAPHGSRTRHSSPTASP
jgi:hypothetical protein